MRIDVRSTALFEKRASEAVLGGPRRSFRLLGGLGMDVFEPVRIGIRSTALFGKALCASPPSRRVVDPRSPGSKIGSNFRYLELHFRSFCRPKRRPKRPPNSRPPKWCLWVEVSFVVWFRNPPRKPSSCVR